MGIDRSGLHLVDVNYNSQPMLTFYRNWCSCVLKKSTFQMKNLFRQFFIFIPVQNHMRQKLVLMINEQRKIINEAFVCLFCFGMWCSSGFYV